MSTNSLCRVSTCLFSGIMSVVFPSTAVSGSLDQSVGRVAGVDGQCCRLRTVATSLVCWKTKPTPTTAVTPCRLVGLHAVRPARRELATACDYFRRLHITDISSSST